MKIRKEVDLHSLPTDNNRIKIQINLIKVVQIFVLVLLGPRYYGNAEIPIKKSANFSGNFRTSQFFSLFFAISNLFRPSCVLYGSKQHIVPRPYTHTHTGRDGNERQIDCRYGDVPSWAHLECVSLQAANRALQSFSRSHKTFLIQPKRITHFCFSLSPLLSALHLLLESFVGTSIHNPPVHFFFL